MLDGAVDLMRRIKADFVYEIGAAPRRRRRRCRSLRRGVCQDFAHIMISGMRGLGLPAAYVSGLRSGSSQDDGLAGADAMHAWCWAAATRSVGADLDPTNGIFAGDDHVVLAIGRDYADVAPIDGVIFASGDQRLEVSVSVTPVASPEIGLGDRRTLACELTSTLRRFAARIVGQ